MVDNRERLEPTENKKVGIYKFFSIYEMLNILLYLNIKLQSMCFDFRVKI